MQQRTIQISDTLAQLVDDYLQENPGETLSTLVQDILEIKVVRKDLSKLLELSGIVTEDHSKQVTH